MKNLLLCLIGRFLAIPAVTDWLIRRAEKTPYYHIVAKNGVDVYMGRWWLLNPYDRGTGKARNTWFPWSVRIHHILRPDRDEHCHDHPWNARTFILRGWYREERLVGHRDGEDRTVEHTRIAGHTAAIRHGEYHKITEVGPGGTVTLFITGPYRGTWGFLVDGVKVQWRKYLGIPEDGDLQPVEAQAPVEEECRHEHDYLDGKGRVRCVYCEEEL